MAVAPRKKLITTTFADYAGNSNGSSSDGDVATAVLDGLTGEIVDQMQQLTVEPLNVPTGGSEDGTLSGSRTNSVDRSSRSTAHDSWIFLDNAAQVFGRSPEIAEVTAADIRKGYDPQGYQWHGNFIQKEVYMGYRKRTYPQLQGVYHDIRQVRKMSACIDITPSFYNFRYSAIGDKYRCQVNHLQLRDLIWATSSYDVFYWHADGVVCWNPWQRTRKCVLGRSQIPKGFKMRSMCVDGGIVFVGDHQRGYCVKSLWTDAMASGSLEPGSSSSSSEEDIMNHASSDTSRSGAHQIIAAHNSGVVRLFDVQSLSVAKTMPFDWAVNCSTQTLDGSLQCVAGDSTDALLVDPRRDSNNPVATLTGHLDYSFSCSFSPDGRLVATGNQDTSIRVYDVRWPQQALKTLCGYISAMRVVRFSNCGRFLLGMESADYVHVYDVQSLAKAQVMSFMGEASGAAFSPDSNCLFLGISDAIHGNSLAEYNLAADAAALTLSIPF
ncbi:hypothetical protein GGI26_001230 [Coemansia sp. RSA 1358]|uniref:WD40 repeat-like protein n=1 Tax=Coemansia umbellata TaxID=1424467 RepID=A0ABQ8PVH7_9FUNG|nr:hypothetical protein EDC05_000911 [Coemansia umbellata]KAJ2624814.1 hypothetical protein GGI26_001230 [Coemansia sp. RSA 1358]